VLELVQDGLADRATKGWIEAAQVAEKGVEGR